MECSEVKVTAAQSFDCGRSDLGGEQTLGPERNGMTAASLTVPTEVAVRGKYGSQPSCNVGKVDVLWEETGICTIGSHQGKGPGYRASAIAD